jgi:hypothetical protein
VTPSLEPGSSLALVTSIDGVDSGVTVIFLTGGADD